MVIARYNLVLYCIPRQEQARHVDAWSGGIGIAGRGQASPAQAKPEVNLILCHETTKVR